MILLPPAFMAEIRRQAEEAWPNECCGLLIGRRVEEDVRRVTRLVISPNVTEGDPRNSFEVDPQLRIEAERALRGTNEEVIGHYHSHPDAPPAPSAADQAQAHEPNLAWLIVAVSAQGVGEVAAYDPDPKGGFRTAEVRIAERA